MCQVTARQELLLPSTSTTALAARSWLQLVGCAAHSAALLDDATLLVSELVTNAVRHGGPPIVLAVECDGIGLHVLVRDGSPVLPRVRGAGPEAEGGRGYLLLDVLSERWGVEQDVGGSPGKQVWFRLRPG